MKAMLYNSDTETLELTDKKLQTAKPHSLLIYNDDVNTFDFVIDSLVEVCGHDEIQAEQCTLLIHSKGKCDVKLGTFKQLNPLKDELLNRGLSAVIE